MILLDANLLLYAHNETIKEHAVTRRWLVGVLSESEPIEVAWITLIAFVHMTTHRRGFPRPLKLPDATSIISDLLLLRFPGLRVEFPLRG